MYQKAASDIRSKSVDDLRTSTTSNTHQTKEDNVKHRLTTLNNRFSNYLNKIQTLADVNVNLLRQIDDVYQNYTVHTQEDKSINANNHHSSEIEFNNLRRQLNNELRQLISTEIRLQRADYDKKFYKNKIKIFSTSDQNHQLNASLSELDLLKQRYEKQEENLQLCKRQYNDYMKKLIEYTNDYDNITFQRIQSENSLYTLKEQLSFECECKQRCQEEFAYLEKIQSKFSKIEMESIIKTIRDDYTKYNEIQLSELEELYTAKLKTIKTNLEKDKEEEDHSGEIKELTLQHELLRQRENDLNYIIEQSQQKYELLDDEYHQLEIQLSDLKSLLQQSRDSTIHLSSEITTYRCLLTNLVSSFQPKTKSRIYIDQATGFTIHVENGLTWVRI